MTNIPEKAGNETKNRKVIEVSQIPVELTQGMIRITKVAERNGDKFKPCNEFIEGRLIGQIKVGEQIVLTPLSGPVSLDANRIFPVTKIVVLQAPEKGFAIHAEDGVYVFVPETEILLPAPPQTPELPGNTVNTVTLKMNLAIGGALNPEGDKK